MTALAGFWSFNGSIKPTDACSRMLQAQQIYAPAGKAIVSSAGPVSVGRRLFNLLPEDSYDRGPVVGEGHTLLVGDVRLDNRDELCGLLNLDPREAQQLADTSVLMQALERWGEEAVNRILGDFSFAWWNGRSGKLVMARDFVGQRPLHYHCGGSFFAFASMPKGLLSLPEISKEPNSDAIAQALALMPETGSETFFKGVQKVLPGEVVTVTHDGISRRRYWNPNPAQLRLKDPREYAEALREQMDRAVSARLRGADGRIASHLSAGLDSSTVTATAARLLADNGGSVTAFTSVPREGYSEPPARDWFIDEWPLASSVAAMYGNVDHVKIASAAGSPFAEIERSFFIYDRPLVNPCNHVWHRAILDEAKRRGLNVLLTAGHGNASISYSGITLLSKLVRSGRLMRLAGEVYQLSRHGMRWGTIGAQAIGSYLPSRLWRMIHRMRGSELSLSEYSAISDEAAKSLAHCAADRRLDLLYRPRVNAFESRVWMFGRVDQANFIKGDLACWGVDLRDPTADRRLAEFCLSVPDEQYLTQGRTRALARRAFADRLSDEVLQERRKGYQAADWHEGLCVARGEIRADLERLAGCEIAARNIDVGRMGALVENWPGGNWNAPEVMRRYRLGLVRGVGVGRFARWAAGSNS